jgi:hypothetical protein
LVKPYPVSSNNISSEVISRKGCTSTNRLPTGLCWRLSIAVLKGTNNFVLSIVKEPSLSGIIFITRINAN